ncbi:hypothetical protein AAHE18_13G099400 [Arachis hypogaea]
MESLHFLLLSTLSIEAWIELTVFPTLEMHDIVDLLHPDKSVHLFFQACPFRRSTKSEEMAIYQWVEDIHNSYNYKVPYQLDGHRMDQKSNLEA